VLGAAVQRQKPVLQESWPKPKSLELIRKKKNHQTNGKNVGGLSSFLLNFGTLCPNPGESCQRFRAFS
jgi:hypothetical protein